MFSSKQITQLLPNLLCAKGSGEEGRVVGEDMGAPP